MDSLSIHGRNIYTDVRKPKDIGYQGKVDLNKKSLDKKNKTL